jgi:hypothetical protein
MRPTIASETRKMHSVEKPPRSRVIDRVARLIRARLNPDTLSAVLQHFRHEGKAIEFSLLVQRCENFLLRTDFDDVTDARSERGHPGVGVIHAQTSPR